MMKGRNNDIGTCEGRAWRGQAFRGPKQDAGGPPSSQTTAAGDELSPSGGVDNAGNGLLSIAWNPQVERRSKRLSAAGVPADNVSFG